MLGIIMAGGQGSRLRPITDVRPKPMVEVLGRPVIDFVKDSMVQGGVDNIIVTTGYRGEMLAEHVGEWNVDGRTARINQESTPMGTAGSVRLLLDEITDTVIIGSGDSVASFDVASLLKAHKMNGAKATMALWEVEDPSPFGIVGCQPLKMVKLMVIYEKVLFDDSKKSQRLRRPSATSSMQDLSLIHI